MHVDATTTGTATMHVRERIPRRPKDKERANAVRGIFMASSPSTKPLEHERPAEVR